MLPIALNNNYCGYFISSTIFRVSSKLKALRVVLRIFPNDPVPSKTDIASLSLGKSTIRTKSYWPKV